MVTVLTVWTSFAVLTTNVAVDGDGVTITVLVCAINVKVEADGITVTVLMDTAGVTVTRKKEEQSEACAD